MKTSQQILTILYKQTDIGKHAYSSDCSTCSLLWGKTLFIKFCRCLKLISLRTLPISLICFHAYQACSSFYSKLPVVLA